MGSNPPNPTQPASREPIINHNPSLQSYYGSLESRIGYRLFLGGTRHFGYYDRDTLWPFPIGRALRRMEDHLLASLGLASGASVLDAGCGFGHVAIHLARKGGLMVRGIDVVDRHVAHATRNIQAAGLQDRVSATRGDYHHLHEYDTESFDGVYTMETLVHATDPKRALAQFLRVLKPGGRIAMNEYDHLDRKDAPQHQVDAIGNVNKHASMPTYDMFDRGVLQDMLDEVGFEDIELTDLTENALPMMRLFYLVAIIPYLLIRFLGLEAYFVNVMAAVEIYRNIAYCRYIAVTARKPASTNRTRKRTTAK